jgi:hypothetical protein
MEPIGPWFEHGQVVDHVAVEDLVDPAPRGVAPDRLAGEPPRDGKRGDARRLDPPPQVGRRHSSNRSRRRSLNVSKSAPSKSSSDGQSPPRRTAAR